MKSGHKRQLYGVPNKEIKRVSDDQSYSCTNRDDLESTTTNMQSGITITQSTRKKEKYEKKTEIRKKRDNKAELFLFNK